MNGRRSDAIELEVTFLAFLLYVPLAYRGLRAVLSSFGNMTTEEFWERGAKLRRIQFRIDRKLKAQIRAGGRRSELAFLKQARETVVAEIAQLCADYAAGL